MLDVAIETAMCTSSNVINSWNHLYILSLPDCPELPGALRANRDFLHFPDKRLAGRDLLEISKIQKYQASAHKIPYSFCIHIKFLSHINYHPIQYKHFLMDRTIESIRRPFAAIVCISIQLSTNPASRNSRKPIRNNRIAATELVAFVLFRVQICNWVNRKKNSKW